MLPPTMRNTFCLLFFVALSLGPQAHPGIGIVCDSKGNIFYTDLTHVWKIERSGKRTIAVRNVHTHELYLDKNDNLYGEHLWYNGERLDTWGHYVWRLKNNGVFDSIIPPTEGFPDNYSFVRDSAGNMYWVQRYTTCRFKKKTPRGEIITIAERKFKDIRWMYASPDGTLYFVDLLDLYKLDQHGKFTLLAKQLASNRNKFSDNRHSVYGIWMDKQRSIYVAVLADQQVKKIDASGKVSTVLQSRDGWYPTGGVFDRENNLWLLEGNSANEVRVRKIPNERLISQTRTNRAASPNVSVPLTVVSIIVFATAFACVKIFQRFRKHLLATKT